MKLWKEGVRIFRCLSNSKVYHFGSVTIRKKNDVNFKRNLGSRANKIFLIKWGISINFFKKHYLKSGSISDTPVRSPKKNWVYYFDLIKVKISYLYYLTFTKLS